MNQVRKIALLCAVATFATSGAARAQSSFDLKSPDSRIEVRVRTAQGIRYDVVLNGRAILEDSSLSIDVDHKAFGKSSSKVLHSQERSHDEMIEPVVRQKFAKLRDRYNEVRLEMDGGYAVTFRVYDEGVAYRRSQSLRRRDEPEFLRQRPGLLSAGRRLHVPQ
jgi:alpha-glucosidase